MRKIILLTGAGFSHDFGGFLGEEMWAHLFNDRWLRANFPKIIELANKRNDVDYETIYYEICFGSAGNGVTPYFLSGYNDHRY